MDWLTPWRETGIVMGDSADLLRPDLWDALQVEVTRVQHDRFARLQATLEARDRRQAKNFLRQWLGRHPLYDGQSIWAHIARCLGPLATAYLEAPAILRFYNLWEVHPTAEPPSRSQLWHRDTEDVRIVKAFLYLSDVRPGAGPLCYAERTHSFGALAEVKPETYIEPGSGWVRVSDEEMAKTGAVQRVALGPTSTLVFADTAGYHKGGYVTEGRRLTALWEWTTAKATEGSRFHALGPQP